jgi:two-component system, LytTR family, sensor kinase
MTRAPWRTAAWLGTLFAALTSGRSLILLSARGESVAWWRVVAFGLAQWWMWTIVGVVVWRAIRVEQSQWSEWRRIALRHLPMAALITVTRAFLLSWLGKGILESAGDVRPLREWVTSYLLTQSAFDLLIYTAIVIAALAYEDRARANERDRQREQLAAQLVDAELRALRMQLHPHFLFNTLHAIQVLIAEQPERARTMVVLLGDLLRSTLFADGAANVPLAQELEFVRRYLEIEQVRFEDRLRVTIAIPDALLTAVVPNFLLQPLVENAIRHGVSRVGAPAQIVLGAHTADDLLVIDVWNTGPAPNGAPSTGLGLSTTRARLERLHGDRASCVLESYDGGARARITIPLLPVVDAV